MSKAPDRPHLVKMSKLAKLAEVPAPTIKHYIRQGLLPGPAKRTSRNMAYYDARLAERVRTIKELQQRHFLPLRLISDILEPAPSAKVRADLDPETRASIGSLAQSIQAGHAALVERRSDRGRGHRREQVLEELRISEDDLALLERLGVLSEEIEGSGGGGLYQGDGVGAAAGDRRDPSGRHGRAVPHGDPRALCERPS